MYIPHKKVASTWTFGLPFFTGIHFSLCVLRTIMDSFETGTNRKSLIIFKNQNQNWTQIYYFIKNRPRTKTVKILKVPTSEPKQITKTESNTTACFLTWSKHFYIYCIYIDLKTNFIFNSIS